MGLIFRLPGKISCKKQCKNGDVDVVRLMHEHGADVNTLQDDHMLSPLYDACANGQLSALQYLIAHGADPVAEHTLHTSIPHLRVVKLLIEMGADVRGDDHEAIFTAATCGVREIVELLVEHGADVTADNHKAVQCAACGGHVDIVKMLVHMGADVTANKNQALMLASGSGQVAMVKYLIEEHHVDVTVEENEAILRAAERRHVQMDALD
jgi:ankyrin repeat protein